MSKTPKFLLCENPLLDARHDGRAFILHAREPFILAEIFHTDTDNELDQLHIKQQFNAYGALDYGAEYVILGAINITTTQPVDVDEIAKIMRRMADWYEFYLIWERNNEQKNN